MGAVESERGEAGQGEAAAAKRRRDAGPSEAAAETMQRQLYLLHLVDQLRALVTGHRRPPPEDVRVDPFLDGGLGRDRHGHARHSTQRRKPTRAEVERM